jgi:hypothetical protein
MVVDQQICSLAIVAALVTGCSFGTPTPIPPPATITRVPTTPPSPTVVPAQETGRLTGHVSIGPLRPVERVGEPTLTPPPEVFTSRSINIFAADGATLVTSVKINPNGTYAVTLPPGNYVVNIARSGIDRARNLPKAVTIASGATVELDIDIDTGIR